QGRALRGGEWSQSALGAAVGQSLGRSDRPPMAALDFEEEGEFLRLAGASRGARDQGAIRGARELIDREPRERSGGRRAVARRGRAEEEGTAEGRGGIRANRSTE